MSPIKHTLDSAMEFAIAKAQHAKTCGMRPFGAVILNLNGVIIGVGVGSETKLRPTRHSEIIAIDMACKTNNGLLYGCTLVSTHQPCHMCSGAIKHSKLSTVAYGSLRSDLPQLFRTTTITSTELLHDTTNPPTILLLNDYRRQCISLFNDEIDGQSKTP